MLLEKKSVKQRILEILQMACTDNLTLHRGMIFYAGEIIHVKDGWVPQSIFANPTITGSTEGKRRLRELRADPKLQKKYQFEMKHEGRYWSYRILPRDEETEKDPPKQAVVDYVKATIKNLGEV